MAFNQYYNSPPYYQQPSYYGNNGASPDMLNQMKGQYQTQIIQQPMPQQNLQPQPTPQQNQTNDIIWVQGEAGAKAYLVAPNNTVTLWDSESPTIYLKTADMNGVPSMRILDFIERSQNAPKTPEKHVCSCGDKFVTKEQFNALQAKYYDILAIVEQLKPKQTKKATKEGAE
jgi:hypothetical protein